MYRKADGIPFSPFETKMSHVLCTSATHSIGTMRSKKGEKQTENEMHYSEEGFTSLCSLFL